MKGSEASKGKVNHRLLALSTRKESWFGCIYCTVWEQWVVCEVGNIPLAQLLIFFFFFLHILIYKRLFSCSLLHLSFLLMCFFFFFLFFTQIYFFSCFFSASLLACDFCSSFFHSQWEIGTSDMAFVGDSVYERSGSLEYVYQKQHFGPF